MKWLLSTLLLFCLDSYAQYPFDKYPTVKYKTAKFNVAESKNDSLFIFTATYKSYKVCLLSGNVVDGYNIFIYKNNKVYQKFQCEPIDIITVDKPLAIADIDGNGKIDFKITLYNNGSGLAGSLERKIYFFGNKKGKFDKICFMDYYSDGERDFDRDGKFEIIGRNLIRYKGHSYWLFDLYHYKNGGLVNVSKFYKYPMAVQYLYRDNNVPTNRISQKKLGQLSAKYPSFYIGDYSL